MAKIPLYVITISLVVGLGSFEFGFGSAVFITSLGQPGFYMYYGLDPTAKREWHWHGSMVALGREYMCCENRLLIFFGDWI